MKLLARLALLATLAGCKSTWPDAPLLIPASEFMPGLQSARTAYAWVLCGKLVPTETGGFEVRDVRCRWLPVEEGSHAPLAPANSVAADLMSSQLRELQRERRASLLQSIRDDERTAHELEAFDLDAAFARWNSQRRSR